MYQAEAEIIVEAGELDPDEIHLSGVYVDHLIQADDNEKRIERLRETVAGQVTDISGPRPLTSSPTSNTSAPVPFSAKPCLLYPHRCLQRPSLKPSMSALVPLDIRWGLHMPVYF